MERSQEKIDRRKIPIRIIYIMWHLKNLIDHCNNVSKYINGKYVPARPLYGDFFLQRLKWSWEVFRGRADAFRWPEGQ